MTHVAIDISKNSFDAAFELENARKHASFKNSGTGRNELHRWLKKHNITDVHIFMEATGRYGEQLAFWAHSRGWKVTIANPHHMRKYADSKGKYNKTDRIDAQIILDWSLSLKAAEVRLWKPRSAGARELKELSMEILGLEKMIVQERNRSKSGITTAVLKASISETIEHLKNQKLHLELRAFEVIKADEKLCQQFKLLLQIKGIGKTTAMKILARVDFDQFKKGRQLVGFAGLAPKKWESGTSVRKKEIISRVGHADLRAALYLPAVVAMTHDPEMAEYKRHLEQQGKHKKVIICAIMARLLRKAFALIRDSKRAEMKLAA